MKAEAKLEVIRGLLKYEGRAEEIAGTDVLTVVFLLIHGADEQPVRMSSTTISMALGCAETTLARSTKRLQDVGWLHVKSGKGRQNPNLYTVLLDELPVADDLKRTVLSPAMRALAKQYAQAIRVDTKGRKRRFTEANFQRMGFALQQFLDRHCAGDEQLLRGALNFALARPQFRTKAFRGPHALRRCFGKLVREFKGAGQPAVESAKPPAPAQRVDPDLHPWDIAPLPSRDGVPVFKIQNLVIAGADAFRDSLNNAASTVKETENCALFVVQPDGTKTEQRVSVTLFGLLRSVRDAKTGKDALPSVTVKAA
jgi:hypothetical protein